MMLALDSIKALVAIQYQAKLTSQVDVDLELEKQKFENVG